MGTVITSDRFIKATSYSRLNVFSTCEKRAYLQFLEKIPEPERPPLPNGQEYPNDRGSRVHDELERYVKGEGPFPQEAATFERLIDNLCRANEDGMVMTEDTWCFNKDWRYVAARDFENIWLRVILDVIVFKNDAEAIVIDYKTGKRWGNEISHGKQMQLYALVAFMLFPSLKKITTELWYLDIDHVESMSFTRPQSNRFFHYFNDGFKKMTSTKVFKSKPGPHSCRFCPYKTGYVNKKQGIMGTGDCNENPD